MPKKNVGYEDKHNNSTVCSLEWECIHCLIFGESQSKDVEEFKDVPRDQVLFVVQ